MQHGAAGRIADGPSCGARAMMSSAYADAHEINDVGMCAASARRYAMAIRHDDVASLFGHAAFLAESYKRHIAGITATRVSENYNGSLKYLYGDIEIINESLISHIISYE